MVKKILIFCITLLLIGVYTSPTELEKPIIINEQLTYHLSKVTKTGYSVSNDFINGVNNAVSGIKVPNIKGIPEDRQKETLLKTILAIAWQECHLTVDCIGESKVAGPYQIKLDTAKQIIFENGLFYKTVYAQLFDIKESSLIATLLVVKYLNKNHDLAESIRMYNQGEGFRSPKYTSELIVKRANSYASDVLNKIKVLDQVRIWD